MSVGNCGGPKISLKSGRVDATEAGPFGVPEPETDLEETLEEFAVSGFNQVDAIGLTVCGHSMGNVHVCLIAFPYLPFLFPHLLQPWGSDGEIG
jgi:hypothetical protein